MGFSIGDAFTTLPGGLPAGGGATGTTFLLAERGPRDVLVATVALAPLPNGAIDHSQLSGSSVATDEPVLSSVRGHPGQVAHWVNRGDSIGGRQAIWEEGGVRWTASSELRVADLAAALEPLEITTEGVRDPSHRFEVVGTQAASEPLAKTVRTTEISLYRSEDGRHLYPIIITIKPPTPGSTGVTALPRLGPGAAMRDLDGARLVVGGTDSAAGFAETRGPEIRTLLDGGSRVDLDAGVQLTPVAENDLIATVVGLRRVANEDPRLEAVLPRYRGSQTFCRES